MKKIIPQMLKAIEEYNMIEKGDKIAVGLSGGKDSLLLLENLAKIRFYRDFDFELVAISIDIFGNSDYSKIQNFCDEINVPLYICKTQIQELVFNVRQEKNPCSLCAKLRKGHLNTKAKELGCNKVALGHHADDFIETFFLSISKENRLSTFWPKTFLSKTQIHTIRPFLYVWEEQIIKESINLPIMKNDCPANKKTERENVKSILLELNNKIPNFKANLLESICHPERYHLFDKAKKEFNLFDEEI